MEQQDSERDAETKGTPQRKTTLYNNQIKTLLYLPKHFTEDRKVAMVDVPTGGGKMGIAALTPYVLKSKNTLVIAPSLKITDQLYTEFWYV